jgi:hypothetical protein
LTFPLNAFRGMSRVGGATDCLLAEGCSSSEGAVGQVNASYDDVI